MVMIYVDVKSVSYVAIIVSINDELIFMRFQQILIFDYSSIASRYIQLDFQGCNCLEMFESSQFSHRSMLFSLR
jgi:hypothetical protein